MLYIQLGMQYYCIGKTNEYTTRTRKAWDPLRRGQGSLPLPIRGTASWDCYEAIWWGACMRAGLNGILFTWACLGFFALVAHLGRNIPPPAHKSIRLYSLWQSQTPLKIAYETSTDGKLLTNWLMLPLIWVTRQLSPGIYPPLTSVLLGQSSPMARSKRDHTAKV